MSHLFFRSVHLVFFYESFVFLISPSTSIPIYTIVMLEYEVLRVFVGCVMQFFYVLMPKKPLGVILLYNSLPLNSIFLFFDVQFLFLYIASYLILKPKLICLQDFGGVLEES